MRKYLLATYLLLSLLIFPLQTQAQEVNSAVQAELAQILRVIVQAINNGSTQTILDGISSDARPELKKEIDQALNNQPIAYTLDTKTITENDNKTYTIKGTFDAKSTSDDGVNWELSGLPTSFTFESKDGGWWLLDTNFHERLGSEFTFKIVGLVFSLTSSIILFGALFVYWKKRMQKNDNLNQSI